LKIIIGKVSDIFYLEISNPADETTMFSGNVRNRLLVKWLHISEDECFIYITKENLITCKFFNFNFYLLPNISFYRHIPRIWRYMHNTCIHLQILVVLAELIIRQEP